MAPRQRDGFVEVHDDHVADLLHAAIRTETKVGTLQGKIEPIKTFTKKVVKHVEVPTQTTVKVPVEKKIVKPSVMRHTVKGTEYVPVTKYKEVEETHVEVKEKVVTGERQVWKLVKEPYEEVVKKPVEVTKVKKVPYTEYVPRTVEKSVDVPVHELTRVKGHRYDKHVGKKTYEIVHDEHFDFHPVYKKSGPHQARELPDSRGYVGRVERGTAFVGERCVPGEMHDTGVDFTGGHPSRPHTAEGRRRCSSTASIASTATCDSRALRTARDHYERSATPRAIGDDYRPPIRSSRSARDLDRANIRDDGGCKLDSGSLAMFSTASSQRLAGTPRQLRSPPRTDSVY